MQGVREWSVRGGHKAKHSKQEYVCYADLGCQSSPLIKVPKDVESASPDHHHYLPGTFRKSFVSGDFPCACK